MPRVWACLAQRLLETPSRGRRRLRPTMPITFVGIDLAWRRDCPHAAVAVTRGNAPATHLIAHCECLACPEETVELVVRHATANTVIAVNAPLVIRNRTEQRLCEREVSRRFGRFGVSCPGANLSVDPHPASVPLRELLTWEGFRHAPPLDEPELGAGRSLFEVHAQAAQIALFALRRVIDYKSGAYAWRAPACAVSSGISDRWRAARRAWRRRRGSRNYSAAMSSSSAAPRSSATPPASTPCSVPTWRGTVGDWVARATRRSATSHRDASWSRPWRTTRGIGSLRLAPIAPLARITERASAATNVGAIV